MALFRHWHSSVHTAFILTFTTESASTPRAASLAARSCGLSGSRNTAGGPEARARTRIHSASGCAAGSLGTAARTRRPRASNPSQWPPGLFGHHSHHNGVADETERDWLAVRPRRLHPRAFGHGWHCCPLATSTAGRCAQAGAQSQMRSNTSAGSLPRLGQNAANSLSDAPMKSLAPIAPSHASLEASTSGAMPIGGRQRSTSATKHTSAGGASRRGMMAVLA